jgi:hypothetical protein
VEEEDEAEQQRQVADKAADRGFHSSVASFNNYSFMKITIFQKA